MLAEQAIASRVLTRTSKLSNLQRSKSRRAIIRVSNCSNKLDFKALNFAKSTGSLVFSMSGESTISRLHALECAIRGATAAHNRQSTYELNMRTLGGLSSFQGKKLFVLGEMLFMNMKLIAIALFLLTIPLNPIVFNSETALCAQCTPTSNTAVLLAPQQLDLSPPVPKCTPATGPSRDVVGHSSSYPFCIGHPYDC